MEMEHPGGKMFGAGINKNIVTASLEAIVSAANRILEAEVSGTSRLNAAAAISRRLRLLPEKGLC